MAEKTYWMTIKNPSKIVGIHITDKEAITMGSGWDAIPFTNEQDFRKYAEQNGYIVDDRYTNSVFYQS